MPKAKNGVSAADILKKGSRASELATLETLAFDFHFDSCLFFFCFCFFFVLFLVSFSRVSAFLAPVEPLLGYPQLLGACVELVTNSQPLYYFH